VVRELLKNAVEALPEGAGHVVISLKHVPERGRVQIMVRDSGQGIPDHLRPRLFQPFFTTKEHRQGLSLSRAKRYIEFHNGTLEVIATGPDGTLFQVELPTADAEPPFLSMSMKKPDPGAV
ncbi:MAG: ATP-binding protein, partial [Elusimicrobia bacterium]|nr:ATP-binding protein [Elusimicrobiota bacterium]